MYVPAEKQFHIVFNLYTFFYWVHFDHVNNLKKITMNLTYLKKKCAWEKINDAKWNFKISEN